MFGNIKAVADEARVIKEAEASRERNLPLPLPKVVPDQSGIAGLPITGGAANFAGNFLRGTRPQQAALQQAALQQAAPPQEAPMVTKERILLLAQSLQKSPHEVARQMGWPYDMIVAEFGQENAPSVEYQQTPQSQPQPQPQPQMQAAPAPPRQPQGAMRPPQMIPGLQPVGR